MAKAPKPPSGKTFNGSKFDDVIVGTAYNDVINGNGGRDTITGGGGADTITGGAGGDTFRYLSYADSRASTGIDLISDFNSAEDVIDLTALGGATLVSAYDAARGGRQATLVYDGQKTILSWYDGSGTPVFELYLSGRHDSLAGISGISAPPPPPPPPQVSVSDVSVNEGAGTVTFTITRSGQAVATTASTVSFATTDGTALAGLDYVAGSGTVTFAAGESVKSVTLSLIDDAAFEGSESFSLLLQAVTNANVTDGDATAAIVDNDQPTEGADNLVGTDTNDLIDMLGGNDVFDGRGGDDYVAGGSGDDLLLGGDGSDTLNGGEGNDLLLGGAGSNRLNGDAGDDLLHTAGLGLDQLDGGTGLDTFELGNLGTGVEIRGFENGDFEVRQGTLIAVATGIERILGTSFDDLADFQFSTVGIAISGLGGADVLIGGSGADELQGGDGNDVLDGMSGADSLFGGAGNDLIFIADPNGTGTDTVDGGQGLDTIDLRDLPIGGLYVSSEFSATATIASMDWSRTVAQVTNVEAWIGSMEADAFYMSGQTVSISIDGAGGDDNIAGGRGNDYLIGGDGNDWLGGYYGDDYLDGGDGQDAVSVGYVNAAAGVSFSFQTNSADSPFVFTDDWGTQTIVNIEQMTFDGSRFNDTVVGGSGHDFISGFYGNDHLTGGDGDDVLYGDAGADVLVGGLGADQFMSNSDGETDTFRYFSLAESNAAGGIDTIDYSAEDVIDVSQIDVDPETEGLQGGNWVLVGETYDPSAGAQATLAWDEQAGVTRLSLFNDDGDAIADFVVNLSGPQDHVTILGVTNTGGGF